MCNNKCHMLHSIALHGKQDQAPLHFMGSRTRPLPRNSRSTSSSSLQPLCYNSNLDQLLSALSALIWASGSHACIGPRRAFRGPSGFDSSSGGIMDFELQGLGLLRLRALTRAAGFPARFDGCHLYLLVNVAQYYLLVQNLQNNICKTCWFSCISYLRNLEKPTICNTLPWLPNVAKDVFIASCFARFQAQARIAAPESSTAGPQAANRYAGVWCGTWQNSLLQSSVVAGFIKMKEALISNNTGHFFNFRSSRPGTSPVPRNSQGTLRSSLLPHNWDQPWHGCSCSYGCCWCSSCYSQTGWSLYQATGSLPRMDSTGRNTQLPFLEDLVGELWAAQLGDSWIWQVQPANNYTANNYTQMIR